MFINTQSNKIYHFGRNGKRGVHEGGIARDKAIYDILKDKTTFVDVSRTKIINIIKIFIILIKSRNNIIFLHYPLLGVPVSDRNIFTKAIRRFFITLLTFSDNKNTFIFDVSDLPIEQAVDLELPIPLHLEEVEKVIFTLNAHFIFASHSMRDYICKKYKIDIANTNVCINGGNRLKKEVLVNDCIKYIEEKKINFVYAGTLNRGRQIETILDIFKTIDNANLLLMGTCGEWINSYVKTSNIKYIGPIEESLAHKIVSLCDVGLIPYDSSRFYYNIAYPTKLSFYITAGITFLSTNVKEVRRINDELKIGIVEDISCWKNIIESVSTSEINAKKKLVKANQEIFLWDNIFKIQNFVYLTNYKR